MRKNINIPDDLKEAVDLYKDAMNISYTAGATLHRRNVKPKSSDFDKEYSFSAALCYLVQQGIIEQHKITAPDFLDKEAASRYKQLIDAAYEKSLEFDIDKPHRKKRLLNEE